MEKKNKKMMGTTELAEFLDCCDFTIRKLLKAGIPHYRLGKVYRFDEKEVRKWLITNGGSINDT